MSLALIGVSHADVALHELESIAAGPDLPHELLGTGTASGAVLLSTCNRVELYLDADDPQRAVATAEELLAVGGAIPDLHARARRGYGEDVARHLFSVAAGLESMVVGEAEVAGQVRGAISEARRDGTATPRLDRLFGAASRASRQVASTTGLQAAGRSIVQVGLDLVEDTYGPLAGRTVCLIGTGSFARISYAALRGRDVGELLLYSLSGRAGRFSEAHPGTVVPQADLARALAAADVIVTCSGAPHPVIDATSLTAALGDRDRVLPIVDLALTHDVDRSVHDLDVAEVIDLDVIQRHAPPAHTEAVAHAHEVVEEAVAAFLAGEAGRKADPAIVALRRHVQAAMGRELDRVERKHPAHTVLAVTGALDRFANELLHVPTVRARELVQQGRGEELVAALDTLFGLGPEAGAALLDELERQGRGHTHAPDRADGVGDAASSTRGAGASR
ncbi:MAG: glutamyl-tRNA reductase [Nitriliruptoraceae bacterium]